jgi:hypothetical protein
MTAAFQPRTNGPAHQGGSRFFASPPRALRHRHARPAKRLAGQKTAPGIFFAAPPKTHRETPSQSLGTHQESVTYVFVFAPGCAVAPNSGLSDLSGLASLSNAMNGGDPFAGFSSVANGATGIQYNPLASALSPFPVTWGSSNNVPVVIDYGAGPQLIFLSPDMANQAAAYNRGAVVGGVVDVVVGAAALAAPAVVDAATSPLGQYTILKGTELLAGGNENPPMVPPWEEPVIEGPVVPGNLPTGPATPGVP